MPTASLLQPDKRLRVYDLVREAGLDVSDWSNYKRRDIPAANPKYCYDWSFIGPDRVVLCLWYVDMKRNTKGIFQTLNYRPTAQMARDRTSVQMSRCNRMDQAFRTAFQRNLPVRVIIVDGPTNGNGDRSVKRRSLDAAPWHVASYNDRGGTCTLRRGLSPAWQPLDLQSHPISDTNDDLGFDPSLLGRDKAKRTVTITTGVARDPKVRRHVLRRAKNKCERQGCGAKRNFPGFLDVHHILGADESDRVWTCVALCPNCHREAHFSNDRHQLNRELLEFAKKFSSIKST